MKKILTIALSVLLIGCTTVPPMQGVLVSSGDGAQSSDMPMRATWVTPRVDGQRVQYRVFHSTAARVAVSYHVYLPPVYDSLPNAHFPVLYWLHGTGGGVRGIAPISRFFDEAIRAGKIAPMLIVFVNGLPEGMWCDSADGKTPVETVFIREVIPHVDASFRTRAERTGRVVEGFSMGGYGAARLGMRHPEMFAAVSMLAAGPLDPDFMGPRAASNPAERSRILRNVYGGRVSGDLGNFRAQSPWSIAEQLPHEARVSLKLRLLIGDRDFTLAANRQFSAHLTRLGVPHDYVELNGVAHDTMAILNTLGEANWRFYRNALSANYQATPQVEGAPLVPKCKTADGASPQLCL